MSPVGEVAYGCSSRVSWLLVDECSYAVDLNVFVDLSLEESSERGLVHVRG